MKVLVVLVALIGLPRLAQTTTLGQVCRSFCGTQVAACSTKRCVRSLLARCHRDGPGFCLQELCTPSPTTTTTTMFSAVRLTVNSFEHSSGSSEPFLAVHFTVSVSPTLADQVPLYITAFQVTQSGITHSEVSASTDLADYCAKNGIVYLNAGASYSCGMAFGLQDNGSPRTLTYDVGGLHASVGF